MSTILLFGHGSRLSDSIVQIVIVVFAVVRKGRKRRDGGDRLAVKPPEARHLRPSTYQEPDWHYDKPEMKVPTPNGRWHGHESSSYGMQLLIAALQNNAYAIRGTFADSATAPGIAKRVSVL
jgi:hypothetical protein